MKKALSLLLALVLCLSLCACGKKTDAEYVKILESKITRREQEIDRIIADSQQAIRDYEERIAVYEARIADYELRIADYEKILNANNNQTENTEPENTEPQYETVEITLDNWQEYFESEPVQGESCWTENSFGETTGFLSCSFFLRLKEEYRNRLYQGNEYQSEIAYMYEAYFCYREAEFDLEKREVTIGDILEYPEGTAKSDSKLNGREILMSGMSVGYWDGFEKMVNCYDFVKMLRIEGTLYLRDE